jgi:hypothetical protein
MVEYERLNALVVAENSSDCDSLKQAALAFGRFNDVQSSPSFYNACDRLNGTDEIDIVFVSFDYGWERIVRFIDDAKKTKNGKNSAFVLMLKPVDEKDQNVSKSLSVGIHGHISEPYSVDNLSKIAHAADTVRAEFDTKRKSAEVRKLVLQIIKHIDALAYHHTKMLDPAPVIGKLKQSCSSLDELDDEAFAAYQSLAVDMFEEAIPLSAHSYTGVSERVRRMVEEKLIRQYETEYRDVC